MSHRLRSTPPENKPKTGFEQFAESTGYENIAGTSLTASQRRRRNRSWRKAKAGIPLAIKTNFDSSAEQIVSADSQQAIKSPPDAHDANDVPLNLQYMQTRLEIPTSAQYPYADPKLFDPRTADEAIRKASLVIPSLIIIRELGEGNTASDARAAATLHVLSKLHTEGVLHRLAPSPPPETLAALDAERTFHSIMSTLKDDYQLIGPALFEPKSIDHTIHSAFQKAHIPWNVEGQTQVKEGNIVRYNLRVELPNAVKLATAGEGRNKGIAKSVAWAHMLKKFQENGILQTLFPTRGEDDAQASVEKPEETSDDEAADLEDLVTVDKKTMKAEKDAKLEIYNWAARLGMSPEYHARVVKKREPGTRKQAKAKYLELAEVSIELKDLGLKTIRLGRTLRIAETAAAIAFKSAAEEKENAGLIQSPTAGDRQWALLNFDTASQFFDFYRNVKKDTYLEVEAKPFVIAGETHNWAQITINDQNVGRWVIMTRKPVAEQLARLTAAVEIVKAEPQLLDQFAAVVRQSQGKVLREVRSIKTNIDNRTVELMRNGVVEARRAGLSDVRQPLLPVDNLLQDSSNRRKRTLSQLDRQVFSRNRIRDLRKREGEASQRDDNATTSLPMSQYRTQVLELVAGSPYSIIVGATGSGKTTQVPQIILDDAIRRGDGGFCDVICTQPRRLAATSIATRVAAERHEPLGIGVGYHVRFDYKPARQGGSITYCTTGILLEQLKHDIDGIFDTVSHIIIDEVHERSLPIDFLMVLLKRAIKKRRDAGRPVPKVILMSATLDQELFANYFAEEQSDGLKAAPVLSVPGRTFPVQERYIENILAEFSPEERAQLDAMAELDKGSTTEYLASEMSFATSAQKAAAAPVIDWKREVKLEQSEEDRAAAREKEEAQVPLSLAAATITHICRKSEDGAILVFLPGLAEIVAVRDTLIQNTEFGMAFDDADKFKICLLHSALPPHEQKDVIEPEICLSVKAQGFDDSVQSFLSQTIEPPSENAVLGAVEALKEIEALTQDESLTALGRTLSKLPVHPSLGKMILLGIVFRCLDPMIVLSSLDQDRSLFVSPPGNRAAARQALNRYNQHNSDQLAIYEAFKELRTLRSKDGLSSAEHHARRNFLHWGSFKSVAATAASIEKILIESRLVPENPSASVFREPTEYGGAALNRYSDNPALIKALYLAGVHPNVAAKNPGRSLAHRTQAEDSVLIHPSSLNYSTRKIRSDDDKLYAYESLRKTVDGKTMFMKDTTLVTPLLTLLFGGKLQAQGFKLTMDDWLPFKIENLDDSAFATRLVLEFRKALDRMLNGAFNSLSEVREGVTIADDPIRDGFVKATVAVLEWSSEQKEREKRDSGIWVPPQWRKVVGESDTVEAAQH
ncbi:hypothetical protein M409DRAFT_66126 [Zasmidium cellare ATCC 36951]|uniref:RNA helicase n=1 Tax=Zasmidium cellare ATCC 36951 TaxID=1080233 RepID=A0A6A6CM71_ZASCE|nr:uncharacterized protein M409DRAFT_66126 [Zasmidium cellare ATCC 36951]KAF2167022.1 hypothetical protein M409DRAFT_66126 [Zasmidium cellare ATCC 36951]